MHLSATWQILPFQRLWDNSWGAYGLSFSEGGIPKCMLGGGGGGPVIPECMLGYNRTHNMHANSITCTQKFVHSIGSSVWK